MLNVLAFFAHPDDETMFCGGTLAYLARQGAEVRYLSATRGEGGELGEPPVCPRKELGRVREAELRCAVRALGGAGLNFLEYQDPEVGPENVLYPFTADHEVLTAELLEHVLELQPEVVFTHGRLGEYGHPAHVIAHRGMMDAVGLLEENQPVVYTIFRERDQARHPERERLEGPDLKLDISPTLEDKIAAARCHRSQHALFLRNAALRAGHPLTLPELISGREDLVREDYPGDPPGNQGIEHLVKPLLLA